MKKDTYTAQSGMQMRLDFNGAMNTTFKNTKRNDHAYEAHEQNYRIR